MLCTRCEARLKVLTSRWVPQRTFKPRSKQTCCDLHVTMQISMGPCLVGHCCDTLYVILCLATQSLLWWSLFRQSQRAMVVHRWQPSVTALDVLDQDTCKSLTMPCTGRMSTWHHSFERPALHIAVQICSTHKQQGLCRIVSLHIG